MAWVTVLGLRLMAYNLVSRLRCRYLLRRAERAAAKRRWQEWCDVILLVIAGKDGAARAPAGLTGD